MEGKAISVIIPAYNCEKTLKRAVLSVVIQSLKPIEVIIVDNDSTDGTSEEIKKLEKLFPGLVIALKEDRRGANFARNKGLQHANGRWIQFLDADDALLESKLAHQLKIVNNHPATGVIYAPSKIFVKNHSTNTHSFLRKIPVNSDIVLGLIFSEAGRTHSNLWRKDVLEAVGGWDETINSSQEYFLMLKLFKKGVKFYMDEQINTVIYREGESVSFTNNTNRAMAILEDKLHYLNDLSDYLRHRWPDSNYYLKLIEKVKSRLYYSELIEYAGNLNGSFGKIQKKYGVQKKVLNKLWSYVHFVYGRYVHGKKKNKYLWFSVHFIRERNRLFLK